MAASCSSKRKASSLFSKRRPSRAVRHRADVDQGRERHSSNYMLVEDLCRQRSLKLFVLHDFDIVGFSIKQTLIDDIERYSFRRKPRSTSTSVCA